MRRRGCGNVGIGTAVASFYPLPFPFCAGCEWECCKNQLTSECVVQTPPPRYDGRGKRVIRGVMQHRNPLPRRLVLADSPHAHRLSSVIANARMDVKVRWGCGDKVGSEGLYLPLLPHPRISYVMYAVPDSFSWRGQAAVDLG